MRRAPCALLASGLLAATASCEVRSQPYSFRAPVVGGVAAGDPDPEREPPPTADPERQYGGDPLDAAVEAIELEPIEPEGDLAERLRTLVGAERDVETETALAFEILDRIGFALDAELASAHRGADLIALAEARGAVAESDPLLGDLAVFDDDRGGESATLVGVVVATPREGTAEFLYESRGVVRRGYVAPGEPSRQRDDDGRALNTFVRAGKPGDDPDADYLAGELFRAFIRLDRIAP